MAKPETPAERPQRSTSAAQRIPKFEAPNELAPQLGAQSITEFHIQGVVTTDNVRDLLDAFGLQNRTEVTFPFQHIVRKHGEIWRMRIEAPAGHTVDGKPVMGHQWTFMRDYPELVGAAA